MKQFKVFITKETQVTLKNNNNPPQIVGIINNERPFLIVNELVYQSIAQNVNLFIKMGLIGVTLLEESPVLQRADAIFDAPEVGGEPKLIEAPVEDEEEFPLFPEELVERPPKETVPVTSQAKHDKVMVGKGKRK